MFVPQTVDPTQTLWLRLYGNKRMELHAFVPQIVDPTQTLELRLYGNKCREFHAFVPLTVNSKHNPFCLVLLPRLVSATSRTAPLRARVKITTDDGDDGAAADEDEDDYVDEDDVHFKSPSSTLNLLPPL